MGQNRIFDDIAKFLTNTVGVAQGIGREVKTAFHSQAEKILNKMNVVRREEFEIMQDMLLKTRNKNEELEIQLKNLKKAKIKATTLDLSAEEKSKTNTAKKEENRSSPELLPSSKKILKNKTVS